jgi:hypothetical protein
MKEKTHAVQHHKVRSSNIESIGHDPGSNTLHIKFKDGGHYTYAGADRNVFTMMLAAPSKGKYFHKIVKPRFKHTKIK